MQKKVIKHIRKSITLKHEHGAVNSALVYYARSSRFPVDF